MKLFNTEISAPLWQYKICTIQYMVTFIGGV